MTLMLFSRSLPKGVHACYLMRYGIDSLGQYQIMQLYVNHVLGWDQSIKDFGGIDLIFKVTAS